MYREQKVIFTCNMRKNIDKNEKAKTINHGYNFKKDRAYCGFKYKESINAFYPLREDKEKLGEVITCKRCRKIMGL